MSHDRPQSRYEILFEPVRVGPVTAPNRFYQTPHVTGMGWLMPKASAALLNRLAREFDVAEVPVLRRERPAP